MKIEDVQSWVAGLISAHSSLTTVPVIEDDGTYPKTPDRERALTVGGVAIVVWQIESDGLFDTVPRGAAVERVLIPVVIEENLAVSRATDGLNISTQKGLRYVREALVGKMNGTDASTRISPADPPFQNFGTTNGVARIVAMFQVDLPILPAT